MRRKCRGIGRWRHRNEIVLAASRILKNEENTSLRAGPLELSERTLVVPQRGRMRPCYWLAVGRDTCRAAQRAAWSVPIEAVVQRKQRIVIHSVRWCGTCRAGEMSFAALD